MILRDLLILKKKKGKRRSKMKKKKEERKSKMKKKKEKGRSKMKKIINDSIIRDIRILFEQEKEENYYEHK